MMLLFEESPIISGFNVLMALLGFVILVGSALIVLMATRRNTFSTVQVQRAEASEALVKTKVEELDICNKKCAKCGEELEDVTAELRAQMGLNVDALMRYWEIRLEELATIENLKQEVRVLRIRVDGTKK